MRASNSLSRLADVVRVAEPGTNNLGSAVADQAEALAPLLGVGVDWLRGRKQIADDHVGPDLARLLRLRADVLRENQRERAAERSAQAARLLVASAYFVGGKLYVDTEQLLGDLLADRTARFVELEVAERFAVAVRGTKLREVSRRVKHHDRSAYVDAAGLHIRWRCGRGGLDLIGQTIDRSRHRVLSVVFGASAAG